MLIDVLTSNCADALVSLVNVCVARVLVWNGTERNAMNVPIEVECEQLRLQLHYSTLCCLQSGGLAKFQAA